MVSQHLLQYANQRLNQVLQPNAPTASFGNISVITFGDFYQLPPVQGRSLLSDDPRALTDNLWKQLAKHNLDEVMRQKDDKEFALLLNRLRQKLKTHSISHNDTIFLSKTLTDADTPAAYDALHVFGTNAEVDNHNQEILKTFPYKIDLLACDMTHTIGGKSYREKTPLTFQAREGCMLPTLLTVAVNCRVMVIANIDVAGNTITLLSFL